ncbi:predicted protein [Uncinocarpus reesii 1704]|uniref:Uncharacterized protein n=1 Tax=Uncinocarpus reesii (strain UAMH 1704) TaxID=336963 RepID=C4JRE3_UNCRE|nr:uncharacterized protein UREG_05032 [Uncinocarpus reesii 1704]EEP80190.1 predicted protein [Uncinocarpus reesii 1704]
MAKPAYDGNGKPLFVIPYIPIQRELPEGITGASIPKFYYLLRLYYLLDHLWNAQLGALYPRSPENIALAHAFWTEHGPRTWEGKRFEFSENWITDSILRMKKDLEEELRISRLRELVIAKRKEKAAATIIPWQSKLEARFLKNSRGIEPETAPAIHCRVPRSCNTQSRPDDSARTVTLTENKVTPAVAQEKEAAIVVDKRNKRVRKVSLPATAPRRSKRVCAQQPKGRPKQPSRVERLKVRR